MFLGLLILCMFVIGLASIAVSSRQSVRSMLRSPEAHEDPISSADLIEYLPEHYRAFLDSGAFRFTKAYTFHGIKFGIWIQLRPKAPLRLFSLSWPPAGGMATYEFMTTLSADSSLTTTTTRAAFVFPQAFGSFLQSFPRHSPEALWEAHLRGEDYLVSTMGVQVKETRRPILEVIKNENIRNLSYVASLPFWFIRGVYWYLVKRFLLQNTPIWRQNIRTTYGSRHNPY